MMIIIIKYYIRMHAAGIQDLAYSTRWNGTEKVKGLIFFSSSSSLIHVIYFIFRLSPADSCGIWAAPALMASLRCSRHRQNEPNDYRITKSSFGRGAPPPHFRTPFCPPLVFFVFFREKWETIEIFILTKWQSNERKKRERTKEERERWKDTELERRENAV